jgi:hypothetical protein
MLSHIGFGGTRIACKQLIRDGGEGNRTPDLLNAIQALSQLSYAPHKRRVAACRKEPQTIAVGISSVNEQVLAKTIKAGILHRLDPAIRSDPDALGLSRWMLS